MIALSCALAFCALVAWDTFRRKLVLETARAQRTDDFAALHTRMDDVEKAVTNLHKEARAEIADVRESVATIQAGSGITRGFGQFGR